MYFLGMVSIRKNVNAQASAYAPSGSAEKARSDETICDNSPRLAAALVVVLPGVQAATIDAVTLVGIRPRLPYPAGLEHRSKPLGNPPRNVRKPCMDARVERRLVGRFVDDCFGVRGPVEATPARRGVVHQDPIRYRRIIAKDARIWRQTFLGGLQPEIDLPRIDYGNHAGTAAR